MNIKDLENLFGVEIKEHDIIRINRPAGLFPIGVAVVERQTISVKVEPAPGVTWETVTCKFVILEVKSENQIVVAAKDKNGTLDWKTVYYTSEQLMKLPDYPVENKITLVPVRKGVDLYKKAESPFITKESTQGWPPIPPAGVTLLPMIYDKNGNPE